QSTYLRVREQPQIRGQDARDGARSADAWDRRIRVDDDVGDTRDHPADQVEEQKAEVTEPVLNVVAKTEQVQHVRGDVQQTATQKHAGEQRGNWRTERWWRPDQSAWVGELDGHHTCR